MSGKVWPVCLAIAVVFADGVANGQRVLLHESVEGDKYVAGQSPPNEITNLIGMKLKLISAGEFMMGSSGDEEYRFHEEWPQHRVRITRPFYLGVYEVTQAEYEKVMGLIASKLEEATLPVEQVSWEDANEFCRRLSVNEGRTYRLPTEAEWEYACRAGTTTAYSFGSDSSDLGSYAWSAKNADATHPVGQKRPNAWGLYDMHGNVWEWCQDWYAEDYYANSPTEDPPGATSSPNRVNRGGGWDRDPRYCRSADRGRSAPNYRNGGLGLRVVQVLVE